MRTGSRIDIEECDIRFKLRADENGLGYLALTFTCLKRRNLDPVAMLDRSASRSYANHNLPGSAR